MGGITYVYWMGARLTPWMLHCLQRLDADLRRLFGVHLVLDSSKGIRTEAEQTAIFLSRYRAQRTGSGPFGDVRWWNGTRYVRHSGLGTVAQPGTSNHEIQGTTAAVDLGDSGGAGIGTKGSARSNWLRANAANYGLIPEGFNFGEAWHYAVPNIFTAVPNGGQATPTPAPVHKEDDMTLFRWNESHVFGLGVESIYHVTGADQYAELKRQHGGVVEVGNEGLTYALMERGIQWDQVDAVLRGAALGVNGRYWSRLMAEGIAIRGEQAAQKKTLADVLNTAKAIEKS